MRLSVLCAGLFGLAACAGHDVDPLLDDVAAETRSASHGKSPAAHACESTMFMGSVHECCRDGNRAVYVATPPGESERALFFREILTPCTMLDGSSQCGRDLGIMCNVGPCGGFAAARVNATHVTVFKPTSKPDKCGWEARGDVTCVSGCDWEPNKSVRYKPEPYEGQEVYPAVAGTCPYRGCKSGGQPCTLPDCSDVP
jgi:hypothetical protein